MKTTVTLNLHANYVQVIVRFHKETFMSHVEYSLCGSNVCELLKEPSSLATFEKKVSEFIEEHRDVRITYLEGFNGFFTITYKLTDVEDITQYEIESSRCINSSRGGRSVSKGFKDATFGRKIFINLITAAADKNVAKLNQVTAALYSLG